RHQLVVCWVSGYSATSLSSWVSLHRLHDRDGSLPPVDARDPHPHGPAARDGR
ncbi:hypothetical protein X975_02481, partial [Stegodyphus mimosarum]